MADNGNFLEPIKVAPRGSEKWDPIILILSIWNSENSPPPPADSLLEQAVKNALKTKLADILIMHHITSGDGFLNYANRLLHWIPDENNHSTKVYDTICLFYFVLDQIPLGPPVDSRTQNVIEQLAERPDSVGIPLTFISAWIVTFAKHVGLWMDSPGSLTQETFNTFTKAAKYNFFEWKYQDFSDYHNFNELFYRELKDGARPIDPEQIVYPADCQFDNAFPVESDGEIVVKTLHWKIHDLLQGSFYADQFGGGVWIHAFLTSYNYHRQHSPVDGIVKEVIPVENAAYLDVQVKGKKLHPIRRISASPLAEDGSGWQFLQTRYVIVIDTAEYANIGYVAVLPIGMAQVSGIVPRVKPGDTVSRGTNISYFRFGGSDIVCVFQPKANLTPDSFQPSPAGGYSKYGTRLLKATTLK
jgi:phosphatidylserine decarboxylase